MSTVMLERVELYDLHLPLVEPFIISGGTMTERRSLVVVLHDESGHRGYGESPPFELPFYSEETLAGARYLLEHVLIPRVLRSGAESPEQVDEVVRLGVRGNPFARAALETAAWDLEASRGGVGMAALLAQRLEVEHASSVPCGVALGIPEDRSLNTLRRWIDDALTRGYRRVKIKIAPGWDTAAVQAASTAMSGSGLPLTVDANGGYEWSMHELNLRAIDQTELLYLEQPLAPDELLGHVHLSRELRTPICLDESLRDSLAAQQVCALEGPRVWNVKAHRVGGLCEVRRIHAIAREYGAQLWAGTMPESGIGSQAGIATAALPGFVYPSDLEPSTRWFGEGGDVIPLTMSSHGFMPVPTTSISELLDMDRFVSASQLIRSYSAGVDGLQIPA
jgi:O-succinylbenzoate synthase